MADNKSPEQVTPKVAPTAPAQEPPVQEIPQETQPDTAQGMSVSLNIPADKLAKLLQLLEDTPQHPEAVQVTSEPTATVNARTGRTEGIINKYPVEKDYYPNPIDFLMGLPTLARYNLPANYLITWDVEGTTYETKWGSYINEPRFLLAFYRLVYDDDGVLVKNKRILIKRGVFTEDEMAAKNLASDLGINLDNTDMRGLLNQVRMKRFQRWLEEIFRPKASIIKKKTTKREVIGGNPYVVEEWEEEV